MHDSSGFFADFQTGDCGNGTVRLRVWPDAMSRNGNQPARSMDKPITDALTGSRSRLPRTLDDGTLSMLLKFLTAEYPR